MSVFDRYLLKMILLAVLFVTGALACVMFLTQSLRFLELVIDSGASSGAFWILTLLTLPRYLEIILPVALMIGTIFVYHRLIMDSEIIVMRASGLSPMALARPALLLSAGVSVVLWIMTAWVSPVSLSKMQNLRQVIKADYSSLLFREGVFNAVGEGVTVYVGRRSGEGTLHGLMIHDSRDPATLPATIIARRGALLISPDDMKVVVYDGSRQQYDPARGTLSRLDFERYTIDLPENKAVRERWRRPDERTLFELLNPDPEQPRDSRLLREFRIEAHKRVVSPLLAPAFALIALAMVLSGGFDRRGQAWRVVVAAGLVILIQSLFLAAYTLARQTDLALPLLYGLALGPIIVGVSVLRGNSGGVFARLRRRMRV